VKEPDELRKFNAEIIRNMGYVLCTPLCVQTLKFLTSEISKIDIFKVAISIILFIAGLISVQQSYDIMEKGKINE
jgi:hypothetical protein